MRGTFFCFSSRGEDLALRLAEEAEDRVVRVGPGKLAEETARWWPQSGFLVFISSLGVTVRAIAPHLKDKETDPAVIVVTEDGATVLPVAGAHLGGGRDRAERLAEKIGASAVHTTASDRADLIAPDLLASRQGWKLLGRESLPAVNRQLIENRSLFWWSDVPNLIPPLPEEYLPAPSPEEASVLLSPLIRILSPGQVQLVPRCIAAGMGCRRGTPEEALRRVLASAFEEKGLHLESLSEIRTVAEKMDEPGLQALADGLTIPLTLVSRKTILSLERDFTPSAAERHLDLPGVAEPCAASAGELLGMRISGEGATAALAMIRNRPGGRLTILGTGPGDGKYLTLEGRRVLEEAEAVVGYRLYVDLLPPRWLEGKLVEAYSMGEEEERAERAVALAEEGRKVVLLSGGDPALFGLAGLALRKALGRVEASIAPGLTAVQAAGAMVGAPYVNGLALLSLSDYLQPWSAVRQALEGAALSGLTAALYNPVKRELDEKLAAVREIFGGAGYEEAILIRDAGRPDPAVKRIPIGELEPLSVDMRTLILLPGISVERVGELLLDRRGYRSEKGAPPESCSAPSPDAPQAESGQSSPDFSLMVQLSARSGPVLVAGGGTVGLRKIRTLLEGGIPVKLVSPEAVLELRALAAEGIIAWDRRKAQRKDFAEHSLALIALSPEDTARVLPLAEGTGCLLNCCGSPRSGHWALAAQFRRRGFTVGVGSGGSDPGGSAALKRLIAKTLDEEGDLP